MPDQLAQLEARVDGLLGDAQPPAAAVEDALTEGYAHAMAIERRRLAIERRMVDLAGSAHEPAAAHELREMYPRLNALDRSQRELRARLESLRLHGQACAGVTASVRTASGR